MQTSRKYSKYFIFSLLLSAALLGISSGSVEAQTATSTVPCYNFTRDLTQGLRGEDVARLQTFLIMKGFDIEAVSSGRAIAGFFGPSTKTALIGYQESIDTAATGYFGESTREIISKSYCEGDQTIIVATSTPISNPIVGTTSTNTAISGTASSPCYVFSEDISLRSRGQDVIELNSFLEAKGFSIPGFMKFVLPADYAGPGTMKALERYKESVGIVEEDFGSATRALASKSCAPPTPAVVVVQVPTVAVPQGTSTAPTTNVPTQNLPEAPSPGSIVLTGVTASFETVDDGTEYSPTKATVIFNFTLHNNSDVDIYIGKNPRTSLVVSTENGPAYSSFSFFDASGIGQGRDMQSSYLVAKGTSRVFNLTGFMDNTKGQTGYKSLSITGIPYSLSSDLSVSTILSPQEINNLKVSVYLKGNPEVVRPAVFVPATPTVTATPSTTQTPVPTMTTVATPSPTTTVQPLTESKLTALCYATPPNPKTGDMVYWQISRAGGAAPYTYSWSGTDGLYGAGTPLMKTYAQSGIKYATVTIKSPEQSITVNCSINVASQSSTPSPTYTYTPTPSPTSTYSPSPSPSYTSTPTPTYTYTPTPSPSSTETPEASPTSTYTPSPSPSSTTTSSPSPTSSPTGSPSASAPRYTASLWDSIKSIFVD